jgi:D-sedoheptulose 7-phosphate isomerase
MLGNALDEIKQVIADVDNDHYHSCVEEISRVVSEALLAGNKIFFAGNGGSAAEAQHMAAEYCATLSCKNFRKGYPAIALTTDTSFLTAWTNDFGYEEVFSRQLETLGAPGDIFFAYSTSGNSKNILRSVEAAKQKSIITIGFSGGSGGAMRDIVDHSIVVPSASTARIQELHTLFGHTICGSVEVKMGDFR